MVTAVRCHAGSSEANCGMVSAATGQASTHWPQNSQSSGPSSQVATRASRPRPTTPIAATPWTSSHRRTHLAHRMHFSGSRTISGDASSRGRRTERERQLAFVATVLEDEVLQAAVAGPLADRALHPVIEEDELELAPPRLVDLGRFGVDLHAREHRGRARGHQARPPVAPDDHAHPAAAVRRQALVVAQRRQLDAVAPQRFEQRETGGDLDRLAVDRDEDRLHRPRPHRADAGCSRRNAHLVRRRLA